MEWTAQRPTVQTHLIPHPWCAGGARLFPWKSATSPYRSVGCFAVVLPLARMDLSSHTHTHTHTHTRTHARTLSNSIRSMANFSRWLRPCFTAKAYLHWEARTNSESHHFQASKKSQQQIWHLLEGVHLKRKGKLWSGNNHWNYIV
jgi:hypothetical protein